MLYNTSALLRTSDISFTYTSSKPSVSLTGKAVVLNLEGIHVEIAQRIIDYSAGSTYAIRGNLQKITNYIFLVTPPNVDISGDIPEIVTGGIDLSSFNKNENRF